MTTKLVIAGTNAFEGLIAIYTMTDGQMLLTGYTGKHRGQSALYRIDGHKAESYDACQSIGCVRKFKPGDELHRQLSNGKSLITKLGGRDLDANISGFKEAVLLFNDMVKQWGASPLGG